MMWRTNVQRGGVMFVMGWILMCRLQLSAADAASHPAVNNPDKFGWEVFVKICAPANRGGANDALWETWATDEETFPQNPVENQPPTWPVNARVKRLMESRQGRAFQDFRKRMGLHPGNRISAGGGQEVRRNKPAFDFIVEQNLWHLDGLIQAFQNGSPISFPVESIEIKAQWKPILETDKARFHWNVDSNGILYGLTALHITTKDIPNWFWATFEHVDNPNRGVDQGCRDDFGVFPANGCGGQPSAELLALMQQGGLPEEWRNYRLVDTQIDFVDSTGRAIVVGNSEIEGGFESTSSCTTCHSRAAIGSDGQFLEFFTSNPFGGHIGSPDPSWFYNPDGAKKVIQLDFVWGFKAARPLPNRSRRSLEPTPVHQVEVKMPPLQAREQFTQLLADAATEPPTPERVQSVAVEVAKFVDVVATDDAQAVKIFRQSMASALGHRVHNDIQEVLGFDGGGSAKTSLNLSTEVPSAESIFRDPRYLKNARRFMKSMARGNGDGTALRIIGGAETNDFPDCVAVGSPGGFCCSGTLVAPNVVITAGHCFTVCSSQVFVGTNVDDLASGKAYKVKSMVQHPLYNQGGQHNDLTVLILDEDIPSVAPRAIATDQIIQDAFFVRAVGFGNIDTGGSFGYGKKRLVDIPMASIDCGAADDASRYGCDTGLEFVAGGLFLNKDTCNGDSGGPMYVVDSDGKWYLAGATSRATDERARNCGDGGIYVRIDKYMSWIKSIPGGHWK